MEQVAARDLTAGVQIDAEVFMARYGDPTAYAAAQMEFLTVTRVDMVDRYTTMLELEGYGSFYAPSSYTFTATR